MKSINKLFGIFGVLCVLLGISACSEEAKYTPAEMLTNAQIYFPTTMSSQVDLKNDGTSFDIEVSRVKSDDAISVALSAVDESGMFTIPASVSFAAGEEVAKITIGYDPAELGFDAYKPITLTINDETLTTPYGTSSYTFKAGIPSPWISLGKATFMDGFLFANAYQVELQQNELEPSMYRLVDPYSQGIKAEGVPSEGGQTDFLTFQLLKKGDKLGDVEITNDGLVYFLSASTGYFYTNDGINKDVYIYHPSAFTKFQAESDWMYSSVKMTKEDGSPAVVQLAPYYYIDGVGGWNYTQKDDVIKIIFPGVVIKDYSAEVTYQGRFTNVEGDNFAVTEIELGEDVESAKVAMVSGDDINAAVAGIVDGSIESMEITAGGTVNIPSSYNGLCSVVVVTYAEGEAQEAGSASFEFSAGTDTWTSLGMAQYTEAIVGPAYKADPVTYEVEVQENTASPGLYRLVNPYGAAYPYNEEGDWDASRNYYLVINAQDPEGVYIDMQNTGLNWGDGNFYIYSLAANFLAGGNSLEDVKAGGYCGTLVNGVITFPAKTLLFGFMEAADDLYYADVNGAFKLVLPGATETSTMRVIAKSSVLKENTITRKVLENKKKISERFLKYGMVNTRVERLK